MRHANLIMFEQSLPVGLRSCIFDSLHNSCAEMSEITLGVKQETMGNDIILS